MLSAAPKNLPDDVFLDKSGKLKAYARLCIYSAFFLSDFFAEDINSEYTRPSLGGLAKVLYNPLLTGSRVVERGHEVLS